MGVVAGVILLRRPRARAESRAGLGRSILIALGLGGTLGVGVRQLGAAVPLQLLTPSVVVAGLLVVAAEELLFRGVLQRSLSEELAARGLSPPWARLGGAVGSVVLAVVAVKASHSATVPTVALDRQLRHCRDRLGADRADGRGWLARAVGGCVAALLG